MIETIIFALMIAFVQGKDLIPLMSSIGMIPLYVSTAIYLLVILLKISNVKIVIKLEKFMPLVLLLSTTSIIYLTLIYHLYIVLTIGVVLFILGVVLNQIAVRSNQGKMPMFPSLCFTTKMITEGKIKDSKTHTLGDENTKFIPLCDIFDFGYNIFSIGDFMLFSVFGLVIYQCIK